MCDENIMLHILEFRWNIIEMRLEWKKPYLASEHWVSITIYRNGLDRTETDFETTETDLQEFQNRQDRALNT